MRIGGADPAIQDRPGASGHGGLLHPRVEAARLAGRAHGLLDGLDDGRAQVGQCHRRGTHLEGAQEERWVVGSDHPDDVESDDVAFLVVIGGDQDRRVVGKRPQRPLEAVCEPALGQAAELTRAHPGEPEPEEVEAVGIGEGESLRHPHTGALPHEADDMMPGAELLPAFGYDEYLHGSSVWTDSTKEQLPQIAPRDS